MGNERGGFTICWWFEPILENKIIRNSEGLRIFSILSREISILPIRLGFERSYPLLFDKPLFWKSCLWGQNDPRLVR
jgi:hypothetical protein